MHRLALLVLAAGAPPAMAQTAVTVYGVVDLGVSRDTDSGLTATKLDSGNQTASRLGFKGTESLGHGYTANFVIESQIEADTGVPSFAGKVFGSQVWVGLAGPLGAVKLGRMFTPYFGAIATNDPFDAKGPGESTRVFQDSGVRMDNTIRYSLPAMGGWYGDLAYGMGEVGGNSTANRQLSADFGYAAGPANVVLAYHASNDAQGRKLVRSVLVGGNYNFGAWRAWALLARNDNDGALDTRDLLLGVSVPFGPHTLAASYVRKQDKFKANADATQIALAHYYTLSRRTNTYLIASNLDNEDGARYQAARLGGTRRLLTGGIRHQF